MNLRDRGYRVVRESVSMIRDKYNVILLTIDCLRYDIFHSLLKLGRLKNIGSIVKKGVFFREAYSNGSWTPPSIISLLTSTYPLMFDGYLNYSPRIFVSKLLQRNNYITITYQTNAWISRYFQMNKGFTEFMDLFDEMEKRGTERTKNRLFLLKKILGKKEWYRKIHLIKKSISMHFKGIKLAYIDAFNLNKLNMNLVKKYGYELSRGRKSLFLWIHYMDVHEPYYPSNNSLYEIYRSLLINEKIRKQRAFSENEKRMLMRFYIEKLTLIDNAIGELLLDLEDLGVNMRNSYFIITADHGQEFYEHGIFGHGLHLYNELIHVPLIISGPETRHREIDYRVSLIDLAPTMISLTKLDNDAKNKFLGKDISYVIFNSASSIGEIRTIISEEGVEKRRSAFETKLRVIKLDKKYAKVAMIRGDWKYIFNRNGTDELYNLRRDPRETNNLIHSETDIASEFLAEIRKHIMWEEKTTKAQNLYLKIRKLRRIRS